MEWEQRIKDGRPNTLPDILRLVWMLILGIILILCLLSKQISYYFDLQAISNVFLIPAGTIILFLIYKLSEKIKDRGNIFFSSGKFFFCFLILWFLQILAVYSYYFSTGWDVSLLVGTASQIVHGEAVTTLDYYSMYPNNLFLLSLFVGIEKVLHATGFHDWEYFSLLVISCGLNTLTGAVLWNALKRSGMNNGQTFAGYLLFFLLVGISPWASIPYSDSFALLFPVLEYDLYLILKTQNEKKKRIVLCVTLGITGALGYQIKPQTIFVLLAIGIVEMFSVRKNQTQSSRRSWCKKIALLFIGFFVGELFAKLCITLLGLRMDSNAAFGPAHFLMMGLNAKAQGIWNAEDVAFSASFPLKSERTLANLQEAWNRLKNLGGIGLLQLFARKTLSNFNDGTFSWGMEGSFFQFYPEVKIPVLSYFIRSFYYCGDYEGKFYPLWKNLEQTLWMGTLFWTFLAGLKREKFEETGKSVLQLSILILALFEMLFECRARYLLTYVPLFILLAVDGLSNITAFCRKDNIFRGSKLKNKN